MLLRTVLLTSAALSLGVAAPAAACDQHGPGQMGGFHRYNPFANAFNNVETAASKVFAKENTDRAAREKSEKTKKEDKRRQAALEAEEEAEAESARSDDTRERMGQGRQPALK